MEVLGCGQIRREILEMTGRGDSAGWAFGLGLERLAMILFSVRRGAYRRATLESLPEMLGRDYELESPPETVARTRDLWHYGVRLLR